MRQTEEPIITISDGKLKGTTGTNLDGEKFYQFFGIPYGKPPVNELRFQPPEPEEPWNGIKDATVSGSPSISVDDFTFERVGSEDCLYLNVYIKKLPNENSPLRPVMFYIHGGGFVFGSNRPGIYGPEFLMIKDIVLVVINYRLGALGFLSVDGTDVYGNMGLKDQNLALKWVQKNIKNFGGDPNNVTIFGNSAGSASVHAHVVSPASKGLFHKAIMESGCLLNQWSWSTKNRAKEMLSYMNKDCKSEEEAVKIMKKVANGVDIFEAQLQLLDFLYVSHQRPFGAVLESPNNTAFLNRNARDVIKEGSYNQVPIMMGYTDTEGMLLELSAKFNIKAPPFSTECAIPYDLKIEKGSNDFKEICGILEKLYSGNEDGNARYDIVSDSVLLNGIIEAAVSHYKTAENPIYLFRISVSSNLNLFKNILQKTNEPGACHADELGYLWHTDISPEIKPGSLEDNSIRHFVELWTNFAEFGNPTPNNNVLNISWSPINNETDLFVLDIGEKLQLLKDIPERKRIEVWREIYKKWPPQNPY